MLTNDMKSVCRLYQFNRIFYYKRYRQYVTMWIWFKVLVKWISFDYFIIFGGNRRLYKIILMILGINIQFANESDIIPEQNYNFSNPLRNRCSNVVWIKCSRISTISNYKIIMSTLKKIRSASRQLSIMIVASFFKQKKTCSHHAAHHS